MDVEQQEDQLKNHQESRQTNVFNIFGVSKVKTFGIGSLLLVVISTVILIIFNYDKISGKNNHGLNEANDVHSTSILFNHETDSLIQTLVKRVARSFTQIGTPDDYGYINIYISESCDDDSPHTYDEIRFPYARYDRHRFSFSNSFVRISPSMPMYVDQLTQQTILYSSQAVYILPHLRNYDGKIFSVAQLIADKYATFSRNGVPMSSHFDIDDYKQYRSRLHDQMPSFNPRTGGFNQGIQSTYRSQFQSGCENDKDYERGDRKSRSYNQYKGQTNDYYSKPHTGSYAPDTLCKKLENNLYQVTTTLPGFQPFYLLLTLLPKGLLIETSNIGNGNSATELGVNLQFSVHTGFYECLAGNIVRANSLGYIYKTDALKVLAINGAIAVHNYYFQFLKNDARKCIGTLQFDFYKTGSDPTNSNNEHVYKSSVANVTCEYLSARGFISS